MNSSFPKFKGVAITAGVSFWFFILSITIGFFRLEVFVAFVAATLILTQIFAVKLSGALDIFAIINTKIFLGILFIFVISIYGIFFRLLGIDLLRLKKQKETYWLPMEQLKGSGISKQF